MENNTSEKKKRIRLVASILIVIANLIYAAWGGMAAAWPEHLPGPGGKPILPAGYEGYTGGSWTELVSTSPKAAQYMEILFSMYGLFCFIFGMMAVTIAATAFRKGERWAWWTLLFSNLIAYIAAMRYDWIVNAIGPFELTEYLGLTVVCIALALTYRSTTNLQPGPKTS